ncbi:MAG TPA: hypothetical protein VMU80_28195 [Bryobacteraceae bacterium]|nr:hypothetical protein [Bryobacteraceae bacterium]
MPFCRQCGAQLIGPYCADCGSPAPLKTSTRIWVLAAMVGLFVLGGGLLLVSQAKHAGSDARLMRNNPGLATGKLLAATNPDIEIISTDEDKGRVTIRQKSTGKVITVDLDKMRQGKITFPNDRANQAGVASSSSSNNAR